MSDGSTGIPNFPTGKIVVGSTGVGLYTDGVLCNGSSGSFLQEVNPRTNNPNNNQPCFIAKIFKVQESQKPN
ncbi:MAG: hypothetical protein ACKOXR_02630, partial [Bacteroidota bacterium]